MEESHRFPEEPLEEDLVNGINNNNDIVADVIARINAQV
jgi:hypothetical protein